MTCLKLFEMSKQLQFCWKCGSEGFQPNADNGSFILSAIPFWGPFDCTCSRLVLFPTRWEGLPCQRLSPCSCAHRKHPARAGFLFFSKKKQINFYWSIIVLQGCASFYCAAKWVSYPYTHTLSFVDFLPV